MHRSAVSLSLDTVRRFGRVLHPRSAAAYTLHGSLAAALGGASDPKAVEAAHRSATACIAALEAAFPQLYLDEAALTTILGMIPLIVDPFFSSMAVTVMFGLAVATVLTLVIIPVFYALVFRVPSPAK